MRFVLICLFVSMLMVIASGCKKGDPEQQPVAVAVEKGIETVEETSTVVAAKADTVVNKQWYLTEMTLEGEKIELAETVPFLSFKAGGMVAGMASVNMLFGKYEISEEGDITWLGEMGTTRMAGAENLMAQEANFLKALPMTTKATMEGEKLKLSNDDATAILVFSVKE